MGMKITKTHFQIELSYRTANAVGSGGSGIPLIGDWKYNIVRTLAARSWGCRNAHGLHSHMLSGMTVIAQKSGRATRLSEKKRSIYKSLQQYFWSMNKEFFQRKISELNDDKLIDLLRTTNNSSNTEIFELARQEAERRKLNFEIQNPP